jgi:hypothetical protein
LNGARLVAAVARLVAAGAALVAAAGAVSVAAAGAVPVGAAVADDPAHDAVKRATMAITAKLVSRWPRRL